jgi:hypothetical protein
MKAIDRQRERAAASVEWVHREERLRILEILEGKLRQMK